MKEFKHIPGRKVFELTLDQGEKAFVTYLIRDDGVYNLNYSQVPFSLRGQGVGRELVIKTFEFLRENNLKYVPTCGYIRHVASRHPEWKDLLAE